jgi:YggT family protein
MHELAQLVRLVVQIEVILIFVRVLLSWFPGIPPWHPLARALAAVTDPVLLPFRRVIPTLGGLDFSPIIAIVVLQLVGGFASDLIDSGGTGAPLAYSLANAFRNVVHAILLILIIIVLLRVVVSFLKVSPFHPAVRLIRDMSSPLVRPFAGMGPRTPTADVPAIVALAVYVVAIVVADWLLGDLVRSTASAALS